MSFYNFPHHWLLGKQIDSLFWIMQSKLKINRFKKYNMVFKKGGNWCSLTNEAVTYLLKNKKVIFKMCKLTCCADECYKHVCSIIKSILESGFILMKTEKQMI